MSLVATWGQKGGHTEPKSVGFYWFWFPLSELEVFGEALFQPGPEVVN